MKTIAMMQQEITQLKQQRDELYSKEIKHIDEHISKLENQIFVNCAHPTDNLIIEIVYNDDEYGKTCESWTEYKITCSVCKRMRFVNKFILDKSSIAFTDILDMTEYTLAARGLK